MASLAEILSPQQEDNLILVDLLDREVGVLPKLATHEQARLHRAFSVFLYRRARGSANATTQANATAQGGPERIEVLVQRRAKGKYHSGGLLTNSVCSHPRAGETLEQAVRRRIEQELGVSGVACREVGSFVYRARLAGGLTEFEYDHVFVGEYDGPVVPDPAEASEVAWVEVGELLEDLAAHPSRYTAWLVTAAPMAANAILAADLGSGA